MGIIALSLQFLWEKAITNNPLLMDFVVLLFCKPAISRYLPFKYIEIESSHLIIWYFSFISAFHIWQEMNSLMCFLMWGSCLLFPYWLAATRLLHFFTSLHSYCYHWSVILLQHSSFAFTNQTKQGCISTISLLLRSQLKLPHKEVSQSILLRIENNTLYMCFALSKPNILQSAYW